MSGAQSFSRQTDCAEGFADTRATVGTRSEIVTVEQTLEEGEPALSCGDIDVRGKPVITVYAVVGAAGAATIHCNWGIAGAWYTTTIACPAGTVTVVDFLRAADYLALLAEADQEETTIAVAAVATHG